MSDSSTTDPQQDETEIRRLMKQWSTALGAKDVDALTKDYHPDAVLFDACPPYKTVGVAGIKRIWQNCLPYFPESFKSEHRDVQVHVDGNTAFVHAVHHFIPTPEDHPCGMTWMRITVGYRRIDGYWKVIHEHVSIPFNPMNGQAFYITDPDTLAMPDYSAQPSPTQPNPAK